MKCRFSIVLVGVSIMIGCANQRMIYQEYSPEKQIHYSQMEKVENLADYAIYLDEGDKIPVIMTLDSDLVDVADWQCDLILKQQVYFKMKLPKDISAMNKLSMNKNEKQMFLKNITIYLSPDAKRWAPYTDISAVEKAFGIRGGSISFGMGITKHGGINIVLNAETNQM